MSGQFLTACRAPLVLLAGLFLPLLAAAAPAAEPSAAPASAVDTLREREFFEQKIRPVLVKHCYRCHAADSQPLRGGLRLDTAAAVRAGGDSGPAVIPGQPADSPLLAALRYDGLQMPPDRRLPDQVIADFTRWITHGAHDPRTARRTPVTAPRPAAAGQPARPGTAGHWAWQPLAVTSPPVITQPARARNAIDRFILHRLDATGLEQAPPASPAVLLRRLHFQLHGLPPTAADIQRFDNAPESATGSTTAELLREEVDRLLVSPRFGQRWGRHWLDLARYSESNGGDRNVIWPHAWRYRDYVIEAFNADRSWLLFLQEQLAGDLLPYETWQQRDRQRVATGFLTLGPKLFMETQAEQFQLDVVDEQIEVIGRSMLGLTINCARCHDHKFDPIATGDYYALAGILASTRLLYGTAAPAGNQYGHDRPLQPLGENGEQLHGPALAWQQEVAEQTKARNKARSDRYRVVRKKQALENTRKQQMQAKAAAAAIEKLTTEIDQLAGEIAEWDEQIRLLDEKLKQTEQSPPPLPAYAMAVRDQPAEEIRNTAIRIRGERTRKGQVVPRGVPGLFSLDGNWQQQLHVSPDSSGRRELARWLGGPAAPLVARVAVNRIWQHLFGSGLVRSVDNFGLMGETPSHPQLLDWLAGEFMRHDWSVKWLIREIMASRTWQASSRFSHQAWQQDPENRLLWRMQVARLEAEPLRDAMLQVAGQLPLQQPVGSVMSGFDKNELNDRVRVSQEQLSQPIRSVYLPIVRMSLPEQLELFDFADPSLSTGRREQRILPAQQLFLFNSDQMHALASAAASRLLRDEPHDSAARLELAWLRFFGRRPSSAERNLIQTVIAQSASQTSPAEAAPAGTAPASAPADPPDLQQLTWTRICQALFAAGEFHTIE